jgi:hypothetical protein
MDTFVCFYLWILFSIYTEFRPIELSLNEKSYIEKIEGPKAKQYELLASVPCRAGNDYYTLAQVVTHGEQLVKKSDGINVLAGVQQVLIVRFVLFDHIHLLVRLVH